MLDWTQEELAENAQVARATVADFERNIRIPMRNNILSIISSLEAAGIEFIIENEGGAGVKFRKVELEFIKEIKTDPDGVTLRVRYSGTKYLVRIPCEVVDDIDRTHYSTQDEMGIAVNKKLPIFLRATEETIILGHISDNNIVFLDHSKFPEGTF